MTHSPTGRELTGHDLPRRAFTFSTAKVPTLQRSVFAFHLPRGHAMSKKAEPLFFQRYEPLAALRFESFCVHFFWGSFMPSTVLRESCTHKAGSRTRHSALLPALRSQAARLAQARTARAWASSQAAA